MKSLFRFGAGALLLMGAAPAPAAAQVYPERLAAEIRHAATSYQRRDRDNGREEQTERTTKTVRIGENGSLDLSNLSGNITVTRGRGGEATIEIVKTARGRTVEEAQQMLAAVSVDVSEGNGRAEVKPNYGDRHRMPPPPPPAPPAPGERRPMPPPTPRHMNVAVAYNVTAPAGTHLTVQSISGRISVTDIKGEVNAQSISGDVRIAGGARVAGVKSVSGSVEVDDAQVPALEASSVSGDVTLRRIKTARLEAGSVSGSLRMEDVQCDRISAHTTSGNVVFSGPIARSGRYELKSFSGEIRIAVAGGAGFELEANSFSGAVRSDLPITTHGNANADRGRRRNLLTGTYGDGSAVLDLTTFSGSIVIAKK
jgi:putative adhesin